ncbi:MULTISPECIES: hypothetical protein [Burkholderia]|uniref:hypothetical protein n=1 Tax=Burkholderia TaxID=32008 RepID=UPI00119B5FEE|nr:MULTISPECIES: hypothetical protein [Burkholderia]MBJ9659614.1 hypothetical protein [Burkholderia gladioli]MBJ9712140.1 hypothetical protein [Burkholderia gladioli]MBU9158159.1 hypothetical protein [Burkholderia gladioli]MBU9194324.1 hypothetical protein [Burkholderia gladioli]MBU9216686.1 hypothetical protein [Burkholderia gladioli]
MTATDRAALERWHFDSWSPACRALFDGEALGDKLRFTASLIVVDREVEPVDARTTLLSVGELYAPDGETLFLALWPRSRGAQLLARERAAVLSFVADGAFHQVRLRVEPAGVTGDRPADDGTAAAGLACFRARLAGGDAQRVGYARLTSGIEFELDDRREAVLARWTRQIEQIRLIAAALPG